jgi:EmrB/QacA subfamily drug resistance transporter
VLHATCDRTNADVCEGGTAQHPRLTLTVCILASSLAFVDGSVVNVALPAIGHSFDASADELQWTLNAYLLPLSALLLLGGAAGDHFGRRRLLIAGIALFMLASIACALAPSIDVLLIARGVQGVGAALLMPNSLAILGSSFSGEAKGRAIGTWAAAGAIAGAIGPPLGGWLVGAIGWRVIFYINVPIAIAAMAMAGRYVEDSAKGAQPLDWWGATLATLALGALTWALTLWSGDYEMNAPVVTGIGAGLVLLGTFLVVERRRGDRAMMPLALFASRDFVGLTLLTFLLYSALGGLLVLLPYVLIEAVGYSPLDAGLALLPFALVIGLASRFMGRIAERIGPRWPLTIGPMITAVGFALLIRVEPNESYWTNVFPAMLVIALGMAGAVAPLTTAVLSSVDDIHTGTASGFNSAIARTGGLIATALVGVVLVRSGDELVSTFHIAALVGAVFAVAAGAIAFVALKSARKALKL